MKIVVLDAYTLNPGDLSWDELRSLGTCEIHDRTPAAEVLARSAGAEVLLTNKTVLSREQIFALPQLRYIGVLATGHNIVDSVAARERGVPVTNVPGYGTQSVAQLAMALLLELAHHVGDHDRAAKAGRWSQCPDYCFWDSPLVELQGQTIGIVGYGRIGAALGKVAQALGMRVIACGRTKPAGLTADVGWRDLETLLRESDVVSLHCPLTPETQHLINARTLAWMKPGAFLLNTSRGPLIDEAALAQALNESRIAGAGLDVLGAEPPPAGNPLFTAKNCIITPHLAWATHAARSRLMKIAMENLRQFLAGKAVNCVNAPKT